jgi:uncharacterized membrane protein
MDIVMVKRRRWQMGISLAVIGLMIAAFFAYLEADPRAASSGALGSRLRTSVLCPGSLLFVTWIDMEPRTIASAVMWVIVGLMTFVLYGGIGLLVSRFFWKAGGISGEIGRTVVGG